MEFNMRTMRKLYFFSGLFVVVTSTLAFRHLSETTSLTVHQKNAIRYPDGRSAIAAQTGAPGESTCATCHGASLKAGGSESSLVIKDSLNNVVTEYQPNHTYTFTFGYTISGSKGFQMTALSDQNVKAGNFTAGTGSKINTANSRQYINHSSKSNSSWTYKWTAPSSDIGKITFYVAAGNLSSIYTSKYSITAKKSGTAGMLVNENAFALKSFYAEGFLHVNYASPIEGKAFLNVVTMEGKSVAYQILGNTTATENEQKIPLQLENGTYVVQLFVNNFFSTKKIVVNN